MTDCGISMFLTIENININCSEALARDLMKLYLSVRGAASVVAFDSMTQFRSYNALYVLIFLRALMLRI